MAHLINPDDVGKFFSHTLLGSTPAELKTTLQTTVRFGFTDRVYNQSRPAGVEPATFGFEARHSVQLSYGRIDFNALQCNVPKLKLSIIKT